MLASAERFLPFWEADILAFVSGELTLPL